MAVENPLERRVVEDACGRSIVARGVVSVLAANAIAYGLCRQYGVENGFAIAGAHIGGSITGVVAGAYWAKRWYRSYWLPRYSSDDKTTQ